MARRNKKSLIAFLTVILFLSASSLALFSDRVSNRITGEAGDLCLSMTDISGDLSNLAPGNNRELTFEYENLGTLSMDTRVTYVLSYRLDRESEENFENSLQTVATLSADGKEIKLTKDDNGIQETFETGTLRGSLDENGESKLSHTVNFNFDRSVENIGQKMKFVLHVIVEGKQSSNDAKWSEIHKTSMRFGAGSVEVVPVSSCNAKSYFPS